jgi:DNA-binding response OmpR family regulator
MCTVKASPVDEVRGLSLGCDDYVRKPFHIQELRATVSEVLRLGSEDRHSYRELRIGQLSGELAKERR